MLIDIFFDCTTTFHVFTRMLSNRLTILIAKKNEKTVADNQLTKSDITFGEHYIVDV